MRPDARRSNRLAPCAFPLSSCTYPAPSWDSPLKNSASVVSRACFHAVSHASWAGKKRPALRCSRPRRSFSSIVSASKSSSSSAFSASQGRGRPSSSRGRRGLLRVWVGLPVLPTASSRMHPSYGRPEPTAVVAGQPMLAPAYDGRYASRMDPAAAQEPPAEPGAAEAPEPALTDAQAGGAEVVGRPSEAIGRPSADATTLPPWIPRLLLAV